MANIKDQLLHMYQRPDFEKQLKLWANRNVEEGILCDIYDGEIWKKFRTVKKFVKMKFQTSKNF